MNEDRTGLEAQLDRSFRAGVDGPPVEFLRRVGARRRRVMVSRIGGVAALALLAIAAVMMARGPGGPRSPAPGGGGPVLARDRFVPGRGLDAPGPAWAPPIRAGDDPDAGFIRELLST